MVNWFLQIVQIFTHFSIQTIQTLKFIFVSALLITLDNKVEYLFRIPLITRITAEMHLQYLACDSEP